MSRRLRTPVLFLFLTFVISYALWFASMALARMAGLWLGQVAVLGPALAALIVVRHVGVWRWLSGEFRETRVRWWWLLVPPVFFAAAWGIARLLGVDMALDWPFALGLLSLQTLLVALPEEIGWRAYLTRSMLRTHSPVAISLFVGIGWGLWHGPKLLVMPLLPVATIALSVLLTYAFAKLRGGLGLAALVHGSFNAALLWIERGEPAIAATSAYLFIGLITLAAVALVAWKRDWYFARPEAYSNSTMISST